MIRLARLVHPPSARRADRLRASCRWSLSLIGLGVSHSRCRRRSRRRPRDAESSRAQHLADAQFGPSVLVPILLEGPRPQLDRQGPALVRALARRPDTRVLSAWDAGAAGAALRPRPTAAMIVAVGRRSPRRRWSRPTRRRSTGSSPGPCRARAAPRSPGSRRIDRAMKTRADRHDAQRGVALDAADPVPRPAAAAAGARRGLRADASLGAATAFSGLGLTALLGKVQDVDADRRDPRHDDRPGARRRLRPAHVTAAGARSCEADVAHHDAAHARRDGRQHDRAARVLIGGTARRRRRSSSPTSSGRPRC